MSITARKNTTALLLAITATVPAVGCGIATGDTAEEGELTEGMRRPPGPPPGFWSLTDISAGGNHTCVRRMNGLTYCWGLNTVGQVSLSNATCSGLTCANKPLQIGYLTQQIELGYNHTCVLDGSGQAYCWGDGNVGQLGLGMGQTGPANGLPVADHGSPITFSNISAGMLSTCGVTTGGTAFCWGVVMARPGVAYSPDPVLLVNSAGFVITSIDSVATGRNSACLQWVVPGLGTDNLCFTGTNSIGRVNTVPGYGSDATHISMESDSFTCADQSTGTVQCVGDNTFGQLGIGSFGGIPTPGQTVGGGMQLHGVTTGFDHACALDGLGTAYCWGHGDWNQLGQTAVGMAPTDSATPVAVLAGSVHFKALAAGDRHTCGIGDNGHMYCWGNDQYGQLGIGFAQSAPAPVSQVVDPP